MTAASATAAARRRFAPIADLHRAARGEAKLAFGDDGFAWLEAAIDHQVLIDTSAGDHGPHFNFLVGVDDVDEGPVLTSLHGLIRNDDGVRLHSELERYAHELTWPEPVVRVLESALELDRASAGVNGVVDEGEISGFLLRGVVLPRGDNRQLAPRHVALDVRQLRFRNGKSDQNRLDLRDGHQLHDVRCDDVALLHAQIAGAAIDGRRDRSVAQLDFGGLDGGFRGDDLRTRAFDGSLVGADGLGERIGAGAHLIGLFLGDNAGVEKFLISSRLGLRVVFIGAVARQIGFSLAQRRVIAREIRFGLAQRRFVGAGIYLEEYGALLDEIAFLEGNMNELSADLRLDRNRGVGFDVADDVDVDGNVFLRNSSDDYRDGSAIASPPARTFATGCLCTLIGAALEDEEHRNKGNEESRHTKLFVFYSYHRNR